MSTHPILQRPLLCLALGIALGGFGMWTATHRPCSTTGEGDHHAATEEPTNEHDHAAAQEKDEHGHSASEAADEHGHEKENLIVLPAQTIKDSGIESSEAGEGKLEQVLKLPGEVVLNADRVAHIVPRVGGIVRRVDKNLGDEVQSGEIMAILESRELAEAKALYLAAQERLGLTQANLKSAEELHTKKIMPDLEFLAIRKAQAEAEIEFKAANNKLHALGVSEEQLREMPNDPAGLAIYELRAPFAGTVVEKHCSLGEILSGEKDAFVLADLSTVWVKITVYSQDMDRVRIGQAAVIQAAGLSLTANGLVCYIAPIANESTRTIYARVDLPNPDRQWRPGTFVTAGVVVAHETVPMLVELEAIQRIGNDSVLFVAEGDGFEPRPVAVGRISGKSAEIKSGLKPGERYVNKGAVLLKAELGKRQSVHVH